MKLFIKYSCALLALSAGMGSSAVTVAQTSDTQTGNYLDEIIVTARKRSENVQDTPISITVLNADALEERNISNIGNIADVTPNLTINTSAAFSGSSSTPAIFLRGVGQVDFAMNTDPGVGLYVDGVYISRSVGGLIDLVDVDRVEVLRGPQGTLFGRNTIGGAVNVTTIAPSFDGFEGRVKLTTGSDNRMQLNGFVNIPLSDTVSTRWAAHYHNRDGYVQRPAGVGDALGDDNTFSLRGSVLFEPSDRFRAKITGDYTTEDEESAPFVLTALDPTGGPMGFSGFHNAVVAPMIDPSLASPIGPMGPPSACFLPGTSNPACFNVDSVVVGDPRFNADTQPSFSELDLFGFSGTMEYDLTDDVTVKSITSYRELESKSANLSDGAPVNINSTNDFMEFDQFTQEVQLLGTALDGNLEWILGGFYMTEEGDNQNFVNFSVIEILSGGRVKNESIAAFGQATWSVTDHLDLTAGLRWTEDTRDFTPDQRVLNNIATPFVDGTPILPSVKATTKSDDVTPLFNAKYQISDEISAYATYSQGFKSGGFSQRVFPPLIPGFSPIPGVPAPCPASAPEQCIPSFDPETVETYEIGFKSQLFDNRVRLNAAAFTTDYQDMQINVQIGIAPTTQNAASAQIDGFEVEMEAALSDAFRLNFGAGYLDARYEELDVTVDPRITLDTRLPGVSEWTTNVGASYRHELGDYGSLTARGDLSYRSEFFFDANNEVGEDGYTVLNLGLTWDSADEEWSASIFGTNVTDEVYGLAGASILTPGGFNQTLFARGAEWSASIQRRF